VFEVDYPATQDWKRAHRSQAPSGERRPILAFARCRFETKDLRSALDVAGFDRTRPAVVSLFGMILYLTLDATKATVSQLGCLAAQSE
jgi:O-methyltransferase involved in polyketide biosynthesis